MGLFWAPAILGLCVNMPLYDNSCGKGTYCLGDKTAESECEWERVGLGTAVYLKSFDGVETHSVERWMFTHHRAWPLDNSCFSPFSGGNLSVNLCAGYIVTPSRWKQVSLWVSNWNHSFWNKKGSKEMPTGILLDHIKVIAEAEYCSEFKNVYMSESFNDSFI